MPLSISSGPGAWVKDFVNSDDPRFKGKSKAKRRQQALAAYFSKKRNETLTSTSSPVSSVLRELVGSSGTALSTNPTTDLGNISNRNRTTTNSTSSESPTGLRQPSVSGQVQTGSAGNLNRPSLAQPALDVNPNVAPSQIATSNIPSPAPMVAPTSTMGGPSALTTGASDLLGTTQPSAPTDNDLSKSPRELSNMLAKNGGSQ